jgi:hypothetical protein
MVESAADVLVKEERWPKEILAEGSPSNLPPAAAFSLSISLFSIFASAHHKMKSQGLYIVVFMSNLRQWHEI